MATFPKPTPGMTDEQMIRAIPEEFVQHHEKRNIDGLIGLFTDDGQIMPPFHPLARGKAALRESFRTEFDELDPRALKVETTRVEVVGNIGFSMGTFSINLKLPTGKRIDEQGKWLAAVRRAGATWKIVAHCWNSNLPFNSFAA